MKNKGKEIVEELKKVMGKKTIDVLIPPFVYVFANFFFGLAISAGLAIGTALVFSFIRLLKKQKIRYALGGLVGVIFASTFAYWAGSAQNYFLPRILSSGGLLLIIILSLAFGKPLAAFASHLTRGWPLEWFWRKDIKPAYREVTLFWLAMVVLRLTLQIMLYLRANLIELVWVNTLLGFPFTIGVLILTYLYGIWRLKQLKGPGVDEYQKGIQPPWRGQVRGF